MGVRTSSADIDRVLASGVAVPAHVVRREFGDASVVLNLETSQYHGLKGAAGEMLDALDGADTVRAAVGRLRARFPHVPGEVLERDLVRYCVELERRGLLRLSVDR